MAKFHIKISSILGGQAPLNYFGKEGAFKNSLACDPDAEATVGDNRASGYLVPVPSVKLTGSTTIAAEPLWMDTNPKDDDVYVHDQSGKVYTVTLATYAISPLNNGAALTSSSGNGQAYYDNYMYWATNVDITRYGPLNGARTYNQTYWTSTLSMTPLNNGVTFPAPNVGTSRYPNHVMHLHTDNKLYIANIGAGSSANKGIVSYIRTKKVSVEGDTNNASTYNALDLGYGIFPTALESYQDNLVIAGYEGDTSSGNTRGKRAKVYFWDTTSASYSKAVELPDPLCSALKSVNGVLYAFSGNPKDIGVRVSRYIGGFTFEEVAYIEDSQPPFQGAVDHLLNRIYFGGFSNSMGYGCLYAIGSKVGKISNGIFNVMRTTSPTSNGVNVTSVLIPENTDFTNTNYLLGWRSNSLFGIDRNATTYGAAEFVSEPFRMGQRFRIDKVVLPLAQAVAANMSIAVKIKTDNESTSTTIGTINNTNYAGSQRYVELTQAVIGKHDFVLDLVWSGTALLSVGLPIDIYGEYLD